MTLGCEHMALNGKKNDSKSQMRKTNLGREVKGLNEKEMTLGDK